MENRDYRPSSALLCRIVDDEAEIGAHLDAVIALTRDADASNRDWALLLLAQSELDTPEILAALVAGLDDAHAEARLEALIGVAMREPETALPHVATLLEGDTVDSMALEAAAYVASPSLLPALEAIAAFGEEDDLFGTMLREAIEACTRGTPPEPI